MTPSHDTAGGNQHNARSQLRDPGGLLLALVLGLLVRLNFVGLADFPINDGGLFYVMLRAVRAAGGWVPQYVQYGGQRLPFAYPPLPFLAAASLTRVLPVSELVIEQWLPFAISLMTIVAFWQLASTFLARPLARDLATVTFALLPLSYQWLIMGGGLTRAPGLLFSILTAREAYLMFTLPSRRRVVLTAVFAALTVLCHPEAALFAAGTVVLFWALFGRTKSATLRAVAALLLTVLLSAPWWLVTWVRHGWAILLPAADSGSTHWSTMLSALLLRLTRETRFPALGFLAVLGLARCLASRRYELPLWLATVYVVMSRAPDQKAAVPIALLAGIGATEVLLPILTRREREVPVSDDRTLLQERLPKVVLMLFVVQSLVLGVSSYRPLLSPLSSDERSAMAWVASNAELDARFIVVTGDGSWAQDRSSEWFPALAGRASVATVQGTEWLPGFSSRVANYLELQECADKDARCLEEWSAASSIQFDHVYVVKRPPIAGPADLRFAAGAGLCSELRHDADYEVVFDGPGALIARYGKR